ncbi:MAG: desulfoferrodoxin [Candidatus Moranbacteria bacterium]|nr:desulfoferrodoxin [Candidatus Moranbacteria bacterium]
MTQKKQIYKCNVCGNVVEVLHEGAGELVCCGEPMELLEEIKEDKGAEKHVPQITGEGDSIKVNIGSVPHPMEGDHYIEWAEVQKKDGKIIKKFLKPNDKPEVGFNCKEAEVNKVRIYCNVHGLWST